MFFQGSQSGNSQTTVLLCASRALAQTPYLAELLQAQLRYYHCFSSVESAKAVLAWGRKASASKAERLARKLNLPLLRLEDGFLRSVLLGNQSAAYSVVIDDVGIYYDASSPSRLEALINQPLTDAQQQRAKELIRQWQQLRLSKYNHSLEAELPTTSPYVLLVDQTFGDASIRFGNADASSFSNMLHDAIQLYPQHQIVIKTHPDVFAGTKQGHFGQLTASEKERVVLLATDVHPVNLIQHAAAVFCVTSQMGFEALLWQKKVHCYGMPFYAGWGLTVDKLTAPARRTVVSLEQLVYAALIMYPRYFHPESRQLCEVEQLMSWMSWQRQQRQRFTQPLFLLQPPIWKRKIFQHFLQGARLQVVDKKEHIPHGCQQVVWGAQDGDNLIRVEDGFIRSVGLGADLTKPLSWVFDPVGIYYDPSRPSGLEQLLQSHPFSAEECAAASQLIKRLVALKMTKYNVGQSQWVRPTSAQVILVPGQVESDASIRLGSPVIKSNLALLQQVRAANPHAYIVYKPHPDVQAGLRVAGDADRDASAYCNETLGNEDMAHLLTQVDEVHTLTSLTGFEALLRQIPVVCYGQPFYAGWGLTTDVYPIGRRNRLLSIEQLVVATLMLYPTYMHWGTGFYTTAEGAVTELERQKSHYKGLSTLQKLKRRLLAFKRT